jgi:hypothetical protein
MCLKSGIFQQLLFSIPNRLLTESAKDFTEYSELAVTQHLWRMGCAINMNLPVAWKELS